MYGVGLRGLSGPPGVGMSMAQPPGFTPYSAPAAPGFAHYSAPAPPPAYSPSAVPFSSDLSSGKVYQKSDYIIFMKFTIFTVCLEIKIQLCLTFVHKI